jgi:hypothetical protein
MSSVNRACEDRASGEPIHPELAGIGLEEGSSSLTRSEVLLRGALAAGAIYGVGMVGLYVRRALAASSGGDIDILNFLLTLAYVETAFFKEGYAKGIGNESQVFVTGLIGDYEPHHVTALTEAIELLGGKPVAEPKLNFPHTDTAGFFKLARTLTDTAVSAYNGAAPAVESKEVLELLGGIVQGEARFAAAVRMQTEQEPAPHAFDPALDESQVRALIDPLIP